VSRLLGIAASFAVSVGLLGWLIAATIGPDAVARGVELYNYRGYFDQLFANAKEPQRPLVVWLGDSTIMQFKRPSYPQLLRAQLARKNVDTRVIAGAGFDPYVYYFIVGRVLDRFDPDVVVMVAHLASFQPKGSAREFRYNDLSSYLMPSMLPQAFLLPLSERDLSPARLLLAQALDWSAPEQIFYGAEGLRVLYGRAAFWESLGPPKPPAVFNPAMRETLGDYNVGITRQQPTVQVLEAAVREVTKSGRAAVVVGTPIPYDAMATRPWFDGDAIQRRFDVLRASVEDAGGLFVDLHDLLRQDEFADYGGHFLETGAQRVSAHVFPFVREALRRASLARDGGHAPRADG
jgi:hypothetical protein